MVNIVNYVMVCSGKYIELGGAISKFWMKLLKEVYSKQQYNIWIKNIAEKSY